MQPHGLSLGIPDRSTTSRRDPSQETHPLGPNMETPPASKVWQKPMASRAAPQSRHLTCTADTWLFADRCSPSARQGVAPSPHPNSHKRLTTAASMLEQPRCTIETARAYRLDRKHGRPNQTRVHSHSSQGSKSSEVPMRRSRRRYVTASWSSPCRTTGNTSQRHPASYPATKAVH